jgi:hypothetical protein
VLTVDPDLALQSYFKLNSNLNHCTPESFKQQTIQFNNRANHSSAQLQNKIMSVNSLYQPTLDREFYNSMIEWFGLSDCYDLANQVHGLWFDAHQRAEQQFVEHVNNFYKRTQ